MAIKKGFGSSSIDNIANGNKLDDFSLKSNKNTNNNMRGNKHDIRFSLMISV